MARLTNATKSNPCPICGKTDWCLNLNPDLWVCRRETEAPVGWQKAKKVAPDGSYYFKRDQGNYDYAEQAAAREARATNIAREQTLYQNNLGLVERDRAIRDLSQRLGLLSAHKRMLLDRGLTESAIEEGLFFSIGQYQIVPEDTPINLAGIAVNNNYSKYIKGFPGIAVVTFNADGLATGWQIMTVPRIEGKKYLWAKGTHSSHLPNGELPIQVVGERKNQKMAWLLEGTLKPRIAQVKHAIYAIGASSGLFSTSKSQIAAAVEEFKEVAIAIDAGDIRNPSRLRHWRLQFEFLESLGKKVKVVWWKQFDKEEDQDLDELSPEEFEKITFLNPVSFFEQADKDNRRREDRRRYLELSSLRLVPHRKYNHRYLPVLNLSPGKIYLVSSPCASGKTEALKAEINSWGNKYPQGKILNLGYRNALLEQAGKRLNIPLIHNLKLGLGQDLDYLAINHASRISLCLNSLMQIDIESIPSNSLIIHDEFEAILKHIARGDTFGHQAAKVQSHLVAIYHRVMSTEGAIVCLEDNLTDLGCQGILQLTGNQYPHYLIQNEYQPFNWDIRFGEGSKVAAIYLIEQHLRKGEKIIACSTSQRFVELLEAVVKLKPEWADKVIRLDAKTAPDLKDLLEDPEDYLTKHETLLLITSPVVESGFSVSDRAEKFFDRRVAYIANLDTRSQIQMLHRYRGNVPTDIICLSRGVDVVNRTTDYKKLQKMRKYVAKNSLKGYGEKIADNLAEEIWNELEAKFSTRSELSGRYMSEYLHQELIDRGHNMFAVDWEDLCDYDSSYKQNLDRIQTEILAEENRILFVQDGKALAPQKALAILHSSGVKFEQRQQAIKCLLHQEYPGVDFSEDFLMEMVTRDRGTYRRQCHLKWLIDNHEIVSQIEKQSIAAHQKEIVTHSLYRKIPKQKLIVDLFIPIWEELSSLLDGREYKETDDCISTINNYLLKNTYNFWAYLGINIRSQSIGVNGRKYNTKITNVNKLLKAVGYLVEATRREGPKSGQIRVWQAIDPHPEHRQTLSTSLDLKYHQLLVDINSTKDNKPIEIVPTIGSYVVSKQGSIVVEVIFQDHLIGWTKNKESILTIPISEIEQVYPLAS